MRPNVRRMLFIAPFAIVGFVVFVAIGGALVMLLWNWLMPDLFALKTLTFWQAFGLLALSRILFGGRGFHGMGRGDHRGRMAERWEKMTPEERERIRRGWRGRWGFVPSAEEEENVRSPAGKD